MLASLLAPASSQAQPQRDAQGRISQLLPTVKCSTCHQPVPLDALGEHVCTGPPPVPLIPRSTPTPPVPPQLQPRSQPPPPPPADPSPPPPRLQPPPHQRSGSGSSINSRLRVNTSSAGPSSPTKPTFQHKPSPLSRSGSADTGGLIPPVNRSPSPNVNRSGGPGSNYSTPTTARPPVSFNREPSPQPGSNTLPPRNGPPLPGPPPPHMPGGPGMIRPPGGPGGPMMPPTRNGSLPPSGSGTMMPPTRSGSLPMRGGPPPQAMGVPPPRPGMPPNMGPSPRGVPPGPGPNMPPPPNMLYLPVINDPNGMVVSPADKFVPPAERGIDTKTGGEAGMAGVGRRGFAAAARAAMFVTPHERPMGTVDRPMPGQYNRRPSAAQYLNIDTNPRSTDTPPLSPGSGYSSHSPGPTSPNFQSDFAPRDVSVRTGNTPSPPNDAISAINTKVAPAKPPSLQPGTPVSSTQSPLTARLPFFEKFKNKIPGIGPNQEPTNLSQDTISNSSPSPAVVSGLTASRPRADTSTSNSNSLGRSDTGSSSLSHRAHQRQREEEPQSPHDSDSEYSGLAYADSTDYEDDDVADPRRQKATPPPSKSTLPSSSPSPMDRSRSNGSSSSAASASRHQKQPSRSGDRNAERPGIRIAGSHSRDVSASSAYSSSSSTGLSASRRNGNGLRDNTPTPTPRDYDAEASADLKRSASNSSLIAAALGLSQTPPSEYSRLGGPGVTAKDKRHGRGYSNSTTGSGPGPSVHHRRDGSSGAGRPAGFDRAMETLMEDINAQNDDSATRRRKGDDEMTVGGETALRRMDTSSSSASRNLYYDFSSDSGSMSGSTGLGVSNSGARTQRSNTVQVPNSPEVKGNKLPTRSASGSRVDKDAALRDATRPLVTKKRKPKCRRCNLPIEKQAVSSSDGQLKGKYHKECFNCHECHKPFPDKTFYVFDGRPLCAYHYHEANDSLCAAALCGQPIEGPCAVSHTGDRYHPEHMTCEYPGAQKCNRRLDEYWEVDGRMLCEKHAASASRRGNTDEGAYDDDDDMYGAEWAQSSRAMKRVTRFIDLASLQNQGGAAAGGSGSGSGSAARRGRDNDADGLL